jgi:hypothetical protein
MVRADGWFLPATAPPRRRNAGGWIALAAGCAVTAAALAVAGWTGPVALAGAAAVAGWQAHEARVFNTRAWPALQAVWERSYVCGRCGEVFLPA